MNQTQAAKAAGVSRVRIVQLVEQGRIRRLADGSYDAASVAEYVATRDPDRRTAAITSSKRIDTKSTTKAAVGPKPIGRPPASSTGPTYADLQRAEKAERVRLLQQKRKRVDGELLPAADVVSALHTIGRTAYQRIVALETRLGPYLNEEGRAAIKRELHDALDEMSKSLGAIPDDIHKGDVAANTGGTFT